MTIQVVNLRFDGCKIPAIIDTLTYVFDDKCNPQEDTPPIEQNSFQLDLTVNESLDAAQLITGQK